MANADADITEGSGFKVATYSFSEDAVTRNLQRIALSLNTGVEWTYGSGAIAASTPRVTLATDSPGVSTNHTGAQAISAGAILVTLPTDVALPAGTNHLGQVQTAIQFITVSMTTPTGALAAGDVVAATQVVAACCRANDVPAILHSVTVIDTDDQKAKLRLVLFDANTSLGTEDVAPDIDDTEILTVQGHVDIAVADYVDLGGASYVHKSNLGIVVKPAVGSDDIYLAIYTPDTSTPTYASGLITVRLGFI